MSDVREIVNVQITRETRAASRPGFGVAMILGLHHRFTDRIQFFTSASSVASVFQATDPEYIAAARLFGQTPSPERIAIGRRAADVCPLIVTTATSSRTYTLKVNDSVFTYASGVGATKDSIVAGIVAAVNAGSEPITAAAGSLGTGKFTLTADVTGVPFSVFNGADGAFDSQLSIDQASYSADDTPATDLSAILEANNSWYAVIATTRDESEIIDDTGETGVSNWVEANKKIFFTASDASNNASLSAPESTSLAGLAQTMGYDRTTVMYHASADSVYPEAAVFGKILPRTPGSYTAMFKSLAGVAVSSLTDTQVTNLLAKNALIYQEIGGVPITREGKVASGEFIDTIIGVDWLEAEIMYNVFTLLAKSLKVPYTAAGLQAVAAQIKAALQKGQDNGLISPFEYDADNNQIGGYIVTVPTISEISSADKAARILRNVTFTAWFAGAIHSVQINGVVTV